MGKMTYRKFFYEGYKFITLFLFILSILSIIYGEPIVALAFVGIIGLVIFGSYKSWKKKNLS